RVKEFANAGSPTYPGSPLSSTMAGATYGPAPVMLVGNKCDRVTEREVSTQEGSALAKELGCDFIEASAKNCINVERAFYDVVRSLRRQRMNTARPSDRSQDYRSYRGHNASGRYRSEKDKDRRYRNDKKSSKCVIL
ncbi:Ras GTPase, partial [Elasticomyces elasticus]